MRFNTIQTEDYNKIGQQEFINWEEFRNKVFLITGSTGLIGSNLVNALLYNSRAKNLNITLVLPVRNIEKTSAMFPWSNVSVVPYSSIHEKIFTGTCEQVSRGAFIDSSPDSAWVSEGTFNGSSPASTQVPESTFNATPPCPTQELEYAFNDSSPASTPISGNTFKASPPDITLASEAAFNGSSPDSAPVSESIFNAAPPCPTQNSEYAINSATPLPAPDYMIHLASPTDSKFFITNPADTILTNIDGTRALLDLATANPVKKFVYLSTMETYGFPKKGHRVTEEEGGAFNSMNPRNSYPLSKIACEALCSAYYVQHGVPACVIRATQTFGPGVKYEDGRVFAQFMRCALEKKNIILKSTGLTQRQYLYTADAVSAILAVLQKGAPGQAYSAANPETLISIKDMAEMVAEEIAGGDISVEFDIADDIEKLGYAPTLYMDLDVSKLKSLGWHPSASLREMFERMIKALF